MQTAHGRDKLADHVPDLRRGRGPLIGIIALAFFGIATAIMMIVDWLWPQWTAAGQIGIIAIGFVWAGQFFWRRKEFRAKWGDRAYRNAFGLYMLPGLPFIFAAIAHILYLPGERVVAGWATPLVSMIGLYLVVTGLLLYVRSYLVLGVDNLSMLYVYFPEESRLVNTSIYSILRHPAYSGAVRIGMAFGLWRGTWFSILFGLFMPIGLTLWLRLVEEPELIQRFGAAYAEYRRTVPAFWPRVQDVGRFWQFLLAVTT